MSVAILESTSMSGPWSWSMICFSGPKPENTAACTPAIRSISSMTTFAISSAWTSRSFFGVSLT
jgi:hypothetical protein